MQYLNISESMPIPKIEGKWTGYFKYGKSYPPGQRGKNVAFSLDIINIDGFITGTCIDELSKDLFNNPATIEGRAEEYSVSFIKRYPGLVTLNVQHQPVVVQDKPSEGIQYAGRLQNKFLSNKYVLIGQWDISGYALDEHGNAVYYTLEGTWEVKPA
jgi:hypothetical protein